jgi:sugar phosphate permease
MLIAAACISYIDAVFRRFFPDSPPSPEPPSLPVLGVRSSPRRPAGQTLSTVAARMPGGPSSFRWVVLAGGCVAQASFSAFFLGLPALAPAFRDDYDLGLGQTGLLLASASIGIVLTLFPWGVVTDRTGERRAVAAGLLAAGAAVLAAAFTSQFAPLVVLIALAGAAGAVVNSGTGRSVMGWFSVSERGLAMGVRQTSIPIAGALAAVTLPHLADAGGVRAALIALAAVYVLGAAAGLL